MTRYSVSVVIPTLNEQTAIARAVTSAVDAGAEQIIVADGGSTDETLARARESGATCIVNSPPGRGVQLRRGAEMASSDWVLFLHADNWLDHSCLAQITDHPNAIWGAFRQRIVNDRWIYRTLEFGNALRVRLRHVPFGDQAVFVQRPTYLDVGGIPHQPLMEDVEFAYALRRIAKPVLLEGPVHVDSRRWEQKGVVRQTFKNWNIQIAHALGVSPERLAGWYRKK